MDSSCFLSISHAIERIARIALDMDFEAMSLDDLQPRLERLQTLWDLYNQIYEQLVRKGRDISWLEIRMEPTEDAFFFGRAKFTSKIKELELKHEQDLNALQTNIPEQQTDIENTWGEFDGNITLWPSFRDHFVSAIHNNELVKPALKIACLLKSLTNKALRTFVEWQITDNNYQEAWDRLNEIYDSKYALCQNYLRPLQSLPMLSSVPSAIDLRRMSSITLDTMHKMKIHGLTAEHWDMFIVHILQERLYAETAKQWEVYQKSKTPSVNDMLAFLEKQATVLEQAVAEI